MNLMDFIPGQYKRASSHKGGEYHGPCPFCGDGGKGNASDRFHIWPDQGTHGTFWCRMCGKGGDAIAYLQQHDGLSFREACERLGENADNYVKKDSDPIQRRPSFTPTVATGPQGIWPEKAAAFVDYCHGRLRENREQIAWLSLRGIDMAMIDKYMLGWNPSDMWRERTAWGLQPEMKDDGKPKKLWFPRGIVIPCVRDGAVHRLRIRRVEGTPRYLVIPGSGRYPLVSRPAEAYVIVESELDAIMLDGLAGDLAGIVAMGNDSAKPPVGLFEDLRQSLHISVSLDNDNPRTNERGKVEMAGASSSLWWLETFSQAERVPPVGGKDPGDAYAAGVDVRSWVMAGLPPRFVIGAGGPVVVDVSDDVGADGINDPGYRVITLLDGRELHVTDKQDVWQRLVSYGKIAFSENELTRLHAACAGLSDEERIAAAMSAVDVKEVFCGAYIKRGECAV